MAEQQRVLFVVHVAVAVKVGRAFEHISFFEHDRRVDEENPDVERVESGVAIREQVGQAVVVYFVKSKQPNN